MPTLSLPGPRSPSEHLIQAWGMCNPDGCQLFAFFKCVCVCVDLFVCVYKCTYMFVCTWRPEDNLGCPSLDILFFETGYLFH